MRSGIVTLLTDFGSRDPYVGVMKGVILGLHPDARLVDLTHEVPPQDVRTAAFLLATSVDWFPPGTVHVAVVDPGVGGERRALVVQAARHLYVGPDNGILTLALRRDRPLSIRELRPGRWTLERVSRTFHGRDVFAPAAAHLASGTVLSHLGNPVEDPVELDLPANTRSDGVISTCVVHRDTFGNLITALHRTEADSPRAVRVGGAEIPMHETYAGAAEGELLAYWGSTDYLEIAVNRGSAAERLGATPGDRVQALL